jgi:hypothetical protein
LPTAAEIRAMVHVALAQGVRGILVFAIESNVAEGRQLRLLDDELRPVPARDGSLPFEAYEELAQLVSRHAALLARHRPSATAWATSDVNVITVARTDPADETSLLYVINLDAESPRRATLRSLDAGNFAAARDIYLKHCARIRRETAHQILEVALAPGEGRLYRLLDAAALAGSDSQCNGNGAVIPP